MTNEKDVKRKIAVIGGGTGLTTAWALEANPNYEVTLFEANNRLGGHINSIKLDGVVLEGGAEFIGDKATYPHFHRLLKLLDIEKKPYKLTSDFHNISDDKHLVLPPIYSSSKGKKRTSSCLPSPHFFNRNSLQPNTHVHLTTLILQICKLFNINKLINQAKSKLLHSDDVMTLEEFINQADLTVDKKTFADSFFYPLIAAAWGVSIEKIKSFCAHYAMHYLTAGDNWYDISNGLSGYIEALVLQCQRLKIALDTPIQHLIPCTVEGETKYKLLKEDGDFVIDEATKEPVLYDDVVITTPAFISQRLLSKIDSEAAQDLTAALQKVEYFPTTVAFHQDPRYLSPENTVVHTRFDGAQAANTMCKRWKFYRDETPIMKTWVLEGQERPNNVLKEVHYNHPLMDKNYYKAQQALHYAQGIDGLWHGGILAGLSDSHESGVSIALEVARDICLRDKCLKDNPRLSQFEDLIAQVANPEDMLSQTKNAFCRLQA